MKEKIYTIPVTESFNKDCECPICILSENLENEYIEYILGPSLMEPDGRAETNNKGFCRRHFQLLYDNKQINILGLGLIIDTHLSEQNKKLKGISGTADSPNQGFIKNLISSKNSNEDKVIDRLINFFSELENKCVICDKLNYTMERYYDVILYLWQKEPDFKNLFNQKKGFCIPHTKELLQFAKKNLNQKYLSEFVNTIISMEINHLSRIQEDVNWFTKKFDYRYNDSPWKNSKDALPRSIEKISGFIKTDTKK